MLKKFLADQAGELKLERRLHAIWYYNLKYYLSDETDIRGTRYCISMADYGRLILAAEEKFFNECNTGNGMLGHCHCQCHNSDIIIGKYLLLLC